MEIQDSFFIHENKKHQSLFLNPTDLYREKTKPIFLQNSNKNGLNEYSLTPSFIDPSKSSPPNDFLIKLYARMDKYQKKEINLCNEY
jgi:hypothetical protein